MQHLSQVEQHVEVLLRAHTVTTSYNDGCTFQVVLGSLYVVVEHLDDESLRAYILAYLWVNNLLLASTLIDSLLHHARANGSHLRAMVGVDDGSYDVTTESRTNLIEQILVNLVVLLIFERTNLELGAVGSQTRGQR